MTEEKRYPRVVRLQRVELSARLALEFNPGTGSWVLEDLATHEDGSVEATSITIGAVEAEGLRAVLGPGETGAPPSTIYLVRMLLEWDERWQECPVCELDERWCEQHWEEFRELVQALGNAGTSA